MNNEVSTLEEADKLAELTNNEVALFIMLKLPHDVTLEHYSVINGVWEKGDWFKDGITELIGWRWIYQGEVYKDDKHLYKIGPFHFPLEETREYNFAESFVNDIIDKIRNK